MYKIMGPWSLEELMAARAHARIAMTPEELQWRHERFGGSARFCLGIQVKSAEACLGPNISRLTFDGLTMLARTTDSEPVSARCFRGRLEAGI